MCVSRPRNRFSYHRFRAPGHLHGKSGESLVIPNYYKKFIKDFFSVNPPRLFRKVFQEALREAEEIKTVIYAGKNCRGGNMRGITVAGC